MVKLGAHMSIAGGYYKAVDAAAELEMDVVQLFTKNNNQWAAKPISESEIKQFAGALSTTGITNPLAHASYLINLASPKQELWEKSIDAMVIEWQRAEQLGLDGVVMHPGAFVDSSEEQGLQRIADAIVRIYEKVEPKKSWLLLENTAGQGSCLGWNMAQLEWLLQRSGSTMMVGVCLDTCHAHAAGYDFSTETGFKEWERDAKKHCILDAIRALHLNDSKKGCGSRVDRHEHIGLGTIGREGFVRVLKHRVLKQLPMYLETEKEDTEEGEPWDAVNLRLLRELAS
ncbi:MAG: deoxyribonuclease IV [Planctomycetes bacterium]|nr:deoxyribonuclease IV [Planctomycetota bacterium]